jgi:hypothetical protein
MVEKQAASSRRVLPKLRQLHLKVGNILDVFHGRATVRQRPRALSHSGLFLGFDEAQFVVYSSARSKLCQQIRSSKKRLPALRLIEKTYRD